MKRLISVYATQAAYDFVEERVKLLLDKNDDMPEGEAYGIAWKQWKKKHPKWIGKMEKERRKKKKKAQRLIKSEVAIEEPTIRSPKDLLSIEDSVGDTTKVKKIFSIDYPYREPLVYIDGEIVMGSTYDSHASTLKKWCEKNEIDYNGDEWFRPDMEKASVMINKDKLAFGHISNGMAFIDVLQNCNNNEVVEALQKRYTYKKIYFWEIDNQQVTRLAKLWKN